MRNIYLRLKERKMTAHEAMTITTGELQTTTACCLPVDTCFSASQPSSKISDIVVLPTRNK